MNKQIILATLLLISASSAFSSDFSIDNFTNFIRNSHVQHTVGLALSVAYPLWNIIKQGDHISRKVFIPTNKNKWFGYAQIGVVMVGGLFLLPSIFLAEPKIQKYPWASLLIRLGGYELISIFFNDGVDRIINDRGFPDAILPLLESDDIKNFRDDGVIPYGIGQ